MSLFIEERIKQSLKTRKEAGTYRSLQTITGIDFSSNDYLGLANYSLELTDHNHGSTGSRLISGQNPEVDEAEAFLAGYHGFEQALLFGSGYAANAGLVASIGQSDDLIISDTLIHASLIDGIRLSYAKRQRFAHNDLEDLERQLEEAEQTVRGQVFVIVESLYSMDGDYAPLGLIADLCHQYKAALIVDEAHAVGIIGSTGNGLIAELGLQHKVFAAVYTFGKAVGLHGAIICGSKLLRDHLINFCRPFIYSTAPSPHTVAATKAAYLRMKNAAPQRKALADNIEYFRKQALTTAYPAAKWIDSNSPIQGLIVPGSDRANNLGKWLQKQGYGIKTIVSPTVPSGEERLRISLHSFNTQADVDGLLQAVNTFFGEVG